MTSRTEHATGRRPSHSRTRRAVGLAAGLIALGGLAAGCGISPPARTGARRPGAQVLAFSRCMRSHGVPSFPDPKISASGGKVGVSLATPQGVAQSPAFKTAQQACGQLAPGGPGSSGGAPTSAHQRAQLVSFAACMRSHGVPDFPDPSQGGAFNLPADINQSAPQFQAATGKCTVNGLPININQGHGP